MTALPFEAGTFAAGGCGVADCAKSAGSPGRTACAGGIGGGVDKTGRSATWIDAGEGADGRGDAGTIAGFAATSLISTSRGTVFFTGFLPFPFRGRFGSGATIAASSIAGAAAVSFAAGRESGPFASVSCTSAISASDMKGFAMVATTFRYRSAVAIISGTWPDIITTGIRAVASF